jgi:hypothetical protein
MRCREARAAIVEQGLTGLPARHDPVLRRHLEGCTACAEEDRVERLLREDLRSLREELPFPLDVRARVMPRIQALEPVERDEVPLRHLGWAAAFAAACFAGLLAGLWTLFPQIQSLLSTGGSLVASLGRAFSSVLAPVLTLIALPFKLAGTVIDALGALGPLVARLEPVGILAVGLSYAAMAAIITLVVGRDLRRPLPAFRREER